MADVTPQPKRKFMILADGMLVSMAANATFTNEFPFLISLRQSPIQQSGGCGRCGQRNTQRHPIFNAVKMALANLPNEKKQRLKQLLNTDEIRIHYVDGQNRGVQKIL